MENCSEDLNSSDALGRKIRLKRLLDDGILIENNITQQPTEMTLAAVRSNIAASDEIAAEGAIQDRAGHTTEMVLDAQLLKMNHELVSKVLHQSSEFTPQMYQTALSKIVFRGLEADWSGIMKIACSLAHTTRVKSSMLGATDVEAKLPAVKERQKRSKPNLTQEMRPSNVGKLKRRDKGAQKVNMLHEQLAHIFKANGHNPLPFYKLIIDPNNFMNTVQNAIQMAFLARDNIIVIETNKADDDGYPWVRLARGEERSLPNNPKQAICSLNQEFCKKMIEFYGVSEAMIETTDEVESGNEDVDDIIEEAESDEESD